MENMYKLWTLLLICIVSLCFGVPTVGAAENWANVAKEKKWSIGIAQRSLGGHVFWELLHKSVVENLEKYDCKVRVRDAQDKVELQIRQVDELISLGVDGIVINPAHQKGIWPAIRAINEAGIPVVAGNNRVLPGGGVKPNANVFADDYGIARPVGEYIAKMIGTQKEEIKIGFISGNPTPDSLARREGYIAGLIFALAEMQTNVRVNVVGVKLANWYPDQARKHVESMLTAHPDLNILFSESDTMTRGIMGAIREHGLAGKLIVASFDGEKDMAELIPKGEIAAIGLFDPIVTGKLIAETMLKVLAGENVPLNIRPPKAVIHKDNWQDYGY